MRISPLLSALALAAFVCGCEAEPPPRAPLASSSADADAEITRDAAVKMARTDASTRFRELGGISFVNAQSLGRFWVVELHASSGQGLRYAISRNDGSIKQRSMVH
jgi:hypothetical protein